MNCPAFLLTSVEGSRIYCVRTTGHTGQHETRVALHIVRWDPNRVQCGAPRGTTGGSGICFLAADHTGECSTYAWDDQAMVYREFTWLKIGFKPKQRCTAALKHYSGGGASYCKFIQGHTGPHQVEHCGETQTWVEQCTSLQPGFASKGVGSPCCQGDSRHDGPHWNYTPAPNGGGGWLRHVWDRLDRDPIKLDPSDPRSYLDQLQERLAKEVQRNIETLLEQPTQPIQVEIRVPVETPLTTITVNIPQPTEPRTYAERKARRSRR